MIVLVAASKVINFVSLLALKRTWWSDHLTDPGELPHCIEIVEFYVGRHEINVPLAEISLS